MYEVLFSKKAIKSLRKIPRDYQVKIKAAALKLANNPFLLDIQKMQDAGQATHRVRVGTYRLLLCIDASLKIIIVADVRRRTTQTYN